MMNREQERKSDEQPMSEAEIQQGSTRRIATDETLKRVIKQHPQRDEPRVDSVEPDETPPP